MPDQPPMIPCPAFDRLALALDDRSIHLLRRPTSYVIAAADGEPYAHFITEGHYGAIISEVYLQRHNGGWAVFDALPGWTLLGFSPDRPAFAANNARENLNDATLSQCPVAVLVA